MNTTITTLVLKHRYLAPVKPYARHLWSICVGKSAFLDIDHNLCT